MAAVYALGAGRSSALLMERRSLAMAVPKSKPKLSQYDQQQSEKHKRAKKLNYKKKSKGRHEHQ